MTQEDLATKSQVGRATVARVETCMVDARAGTIKKLAKALGVSPTDLVEAPPPQLW